MDERKIAEEAFLKDLIAETSRDFDNHFKFKSGEMSKELERLAGLEQLREDMKSSDPEVREKVVDSPLLTTQAVQSLLPMGLADEEANVRMAWVVKHGGVMTVDQLHKCMEDGDKRVVLRSVEKCLERFLEIPPRKVSSLALHWGQSSVAERDLVSKVITRCPLSKDDFETLIESKDAWRQAALIGNAMFNEDEVAAWEKMLKSNSEEVLHAIQVKLISSPHSLPSELVTPSVGHGDWRVRAALGGNDMLSRSQRMKLLEDDVAAVRAGVIRNPNLVSQEMRLLSKDESELVRAAIAGSAVLDDDMTERFMSSSSDLIISRMITNKTFVPTRQAFDKMMSLDVGLLPVLEFAKRISSVFADDDHRNYSLTELSRLAETPSKLSQEAKDVLVERCRCRLLTGEFEAKTERSHEPISEQVKRSIVR